MLKKSRINRALKLIKGSKIYFDSVDSRADILTDLSTLPLLTDKTLFYCDSKTNFVGFESRLQDFIEEKLIIPVSNSEETLPEIIKEKGVHILKDELFDKVLFRKQYDSLIQEDLDDVNFANSCKQVNQKPTDVAFSLNWDILLCEALNAPMILNSKIKKVWESKIPRLPYCLYPQPRTEFVPEISKFLNEIKAKLPLNIDIDQIKEFRKEKIATKFRVWLNKQIQNAQLKEVVSPIPVDKYLLQEFNSLAQEYDKSASLKTSAIIGCVSALAGGIFSQDPSIAAGIGTAAAIGNYTIENVSNGLKRRFGKYRWVYLLKG